MVKHDGTKFLPKSDQGHFQGKGHTFLVKQQITIYNRHRQISCGRKTIKQHHEGGMAKSQPSCTKFCLSTTRQASFLTCRILHTRVEISPSPWYNREVEQTELVHVRQKVVYDVITFCAPRTCVTRSVKHVKL